MWTSCREAKYIMSLKMNRLLATAHCRLHILAVEGFSTLNFSGFCLWVIVRGFKRQSCRLIYKIKAKNVSKNEDKFVSSPMLFLLSYPINHCAPRLMGVPTPELGITGLKYKAGVYDKSLELLRGLIQHRSRQIFRWLLFSSKPKHTGFWYEHGSAPVPFTSPCSLHFLGYSSITALLSCVQTANH